MVIEECMYFLYLNLSVESGLAFAGLILLFMLLNASEGKQSIINYQMTRCLFSMYSNLCLQQVYLNTNVFL